MGEWICESLWGQYSHVAFKCQQPSWLLSIANNSLCLENKSQVLEIYHVSLCTSSCVPNTDTTSLFYSHFLALERSLPFSSLCLFIYYFLFIVLHSLSKILLLLNSSSKGSSSRSLGGPFSAHVCVGLRLLHHQYPLALVMNICVLMSPSRVEINSLFPMPDTVSGTRCTRGIREIDRPQPILSLHHYIYFDSFCKHPTQQ